MTTLEREDIIPEITLHNALELYKTQLEESQLSMSTKRSYLLIIKKVIEYFDDTNKLNDINIREYQMFFNYLRKSAPKGIKVYYRSLSSILSTLESWKFLLKNPLRDRNLRKQFRPEEKNPLYINPVELEEIVSKINNPVAQYAVRFAYHSGCRVGEIVSLKWKNIDEENGIIVIGNEEFNTKNRRDRKIFFNDEIKLLFKTLKGLSGNMIDSNEYIFKSIHNQPFRPDSLSKIFKNAVKRTSSNPNYHFHNLRGSFITNLSRTGAPPEAIMKISGHSSYAALKKYLNVDEEYLKHLMEIYSSKLFNKVA